MRMLPFHFINAELTRINETSWNIKTDEAKLSFLRSKVEVGICSHTGKPIAKLKTEGGKLCLHNENAEDDLKDYEAMKNYLVSLL